MDLVTPPLPLHLGPLHPVEQALVYLLAFGPFVVLALVVVARRRQDRREDRRQDHREDRLSDRADDGYDGDAAQRDR